jgi:hypothetical protein
MAKALKPASDLDQGGGVEFVMNVPAALNF